MLKLSRIQSNLLLKWFVLIVIVESLLGFFPSLAWQVLLLSGLAFWVGLLLRIADIYPGRYEPPVLDLLSGTLAVVSAIGCFAARNSPITVGFFIILAPPFALVPHFVYIIRGMGRDTQDSGPNQ